MRAHIQLCPMQTYPTCPTCPQIRLVIKPSENDEQFQQSTPLSSNTISEEESTMLRKFWEKMDNIQHRQYLKCKERIPSMMLIGNRC
jgi:hypothetical protein